MPINWEHDLDKALRLLKMKFEAIDMEEVEREAARKTAEGVAEMVRQEVVASEDINSPARLNSPYDHGPGPSMAKKRAWEVNKRGQGEYVVEPHPKVRRRAFILEYGTKDPITPTDAPALEVHIEGVPHYFDEVSGIDAQKFWRRAVNRAEQRRLLEENVEMEVAEELEEFRQLG